MAVHIDIAAFRSSIPAEVAAVAERLLQAGSVGDLEAVGGGAQAVVSDGGAGFQPWVGVIGRTFTSDCDCADQPAGDDFCAHSVAVALTAFDSEVRFSAAGSPHGADPVEPERADYLRAVQRLDPRQLTDLVVQHALRDRLFATLLLGRAGLLDPTDEAALADFQAVIRDASNATAGDRWEIAEVENAGHRLVAEVEVLRAHPLVPAMLDLIEEAIEVWDELSGCLTDPEEIGDPLVDAHREVCERLDLEPEDIAARLNRLLDRCRNDTVDPTEYADLLGAHANQVSRSLRD